jgi:hypothetical protein
MAGGDNISRRRVLVLSPFATAPLDAGQRRRAFQSTSYFKSLGYEITFLLYAFEGDWYWRSQDAVLATMRKQWSDVRVIHSDRQVGQPPKHGDRHQLDEWWDPTIGEILKRTFEFEDFDIAVVHNVWLSRAFDFIPNRVVKMLETHDVFFQRLDVYKNFGVLDRFFLVDQKTELDGIRRSDISITIKSEEETLLKTIDKNLKVVTVPYGPIEWKSGDERVAATTYVHKSKVVFGFLGGPHAYNISGLVALISALNVVLSRTLAPVELVIGGSVCSALKFQISEYSFQPRLLGYIESEQAFYDSVDVAVVPVFFGTGFKVKVSEILEISKPILCARHASEGSMLPNFAICDSPMELAERMSEIAFDRVRLDILSQISAESAKRVSMMISKSKGEVTKLIENATKSIRTRLPSDNWRARNVVRLISHILHSRIIRSNWNFVIELNDLAKPLEAQLNASCQPGLKFGASNAGSKSTLTIVDSIDAECHDLRDISVSSSSVLDVRFSPSATHVAGIEYFHNYFTNHRQTHFGLDIKNDEEIFPAPLLNDAIRWDPSVKVVLDVVSADPKIDLHGLGGVILCDGEKSKKLLTECMGSVLASPYLVIVASDNELFNNLISHLILCVAGRRSWEAECSVYFTDEVDTWIIAFLEDASQYSDGRLGVRCVSDIFGLPGETLLVQDGPSPRPSPPSIFWSISDRLSKT